MTISVKEVDKKAKCRKKMINYLIKIIFIKTSLRSRMSSYRNKG
jgi:hypothetical protein